MTPERMGVTGYHIDVPTELTEAHIEKLIGQMDGEEFDSLLERFIETQSGPDEPLPGEVFFDLWADIEEGRAPIEINGMVVEGRLVLLPPASARVPVTVSENEIVLGDQVIKIRLVSP